MDGILLVDKDINMTSHDVVNIVRKVYQTKRVGHTGTLDPDASGLLVLGVNKGTKIIQYLNNDNKTYLARIAIGSATTTLDKTGEIVAEKAVSTINDIDRILESFVGEYIQTPPMYSAIKYNGTRLYEYARKGITIDDIPSRTITIYSIQRTSEVVYKDNHAYFDYTVSASKGLYVRTLSYDIGQKLGYPSHNYDLRRLKAGAFDIKESFTLDEIRSNKAVLMPLHEALTTMPFVIATQTMMDHIKHGRTLPSKGFKQERTKILYHNELVAIYDYDSSTNRMKAKQVFYKDGSE
jgi:tRNA pseudouridine55 synthase